MNSAHVYLLGLSSYYLVVSERPFDSFLSDLKRHNLSAGEIVDYKSTMLNDYTARILKDLNGIKLTVHSPLDSENNLTNPDGTVRRETMGRIKQSIDYAAELGAVAFVQHPGPKTTGAADGWELNCDSLLALIEYGNSRGIRVVLENMPSDKYYMSGPSEFKDFIRANNLDLRMVFDVGHSHIAGNTDEFLRDLIPYFFMVHITDNDGREDSHLNVGEGTIEWKRVIPSLKQRFSGMYIVEAVREPLKSVEAIKVLLK